MAQAHYRAPYGRSGANHRQSDIPLCQPRRHLAVGRQGVKAREPQLGVCHFCCRCPALTAGSCPDLISEGRWDANGKAAFSCQMLTPLNYAKLGQGPGWRAKPAAVLHV